MAEPLKYTRTYTSVSNYL